jgi:hypothetical protein
MREMPLWGREAITDGNEQKQTRFLVLSPVPTTRLGRVPGFILFPPPPEAENGVHSARAHLLPPKPRQGLVTQDW